VIFLLLPFGPSRTPRVAPPNRAMLTEEGAESSPSRPAPSSSPSAPSPRSATRRPLRKRPSSALAVLPALSEEANEKREEKAARRQARRPSVPSALGHLRESSVRPSTAAEYHALYEAYLQSTLGEPSRRLMADADVVDDILAETMEELYYEGLPPSEGQKLKAATMFILPQLKAAGPRSLPKSTQALKGWRKLDPPRSRLPLAYEAVILILDRLLERGFNEEVMVTALAVHAYLRPSEAFRILARHLVPPTPTIGAWSLTLHPYEGGHPSKTEVFDEALLLGDIGILKEVAAPLGELAARRRLTSPLAPLFRITQAIWRRRFLSAAADIGLPHAMLYQLRHSGASLDAALRLRSIQQVQQRGRWAAFSSVRRYEKGGRLAEQASALSANQRARASYVMTHLDTMLAAAVKPLF
jgi:hypothetical protein